jgi:nucleotide-binding universal stress UspA family protein
MYQRIVVPVDGSSAAWRAVAPALELASRWDCPLCVVSVLRHDFEIGPATNDIDSLLGAAGWHDRAEVRVIAGAESPIADHVSAVLEEEPGSLVVMSSTGRGRSATLIGSVAESILRQTTGPALVYGPASEPRAPTDRPIVVAITGSHTSEAALGPAGAWAIALHATPWVVTVGDPRTPMPPDAAEWGLASSTAEDLAEMIGRDVEFETLRADKPVPALVEFVESLGAGMLVEATHARTGWRRFIEGSVAMRSVRKAPCPVLVIRGFDEHDDDADA